MTYYLLHWLTDGLIEHLGKRQKLFNFIQDRCGVAGESRYGGMQTSCTQWCAVCLLCICARATGKPEQMMINRDLGNFSTVGRVPSAKCGYFKLVKRLCIDKSLSSQESYSAKTALEAAPTKTFLFLLHQHCSHPTTCKYWTRLTELTYNARLRMQQNTWRRTLKINESTLPIKIEWLSILLGMLCEKTQRIFLHNYKIPITPIPSQAWFLVLHSFPWWI